MQQPNPSIAGQVVFIRTARTGGDVQALFVMNADGPTCDV
jgi:hypothetical protein